MVESPQAQSLPQPALVAEGVTIAYETPDGSQFIAAENISFEIAPGEFVALVGPSGCGKTSLLYAVDGLVPVQAGTILVDGRPVSGPGRERAVVFQSATLFPWLSVIDNVTYGIAHLDAAVRQQRALELLRLVGLEGFARHRPHQLSGGMQQRVNLARALAVDPDLLLLDEPFSALDAQTREQMQEELLRIWRARREAGRELAMLFVTHDIAEAVFLADRVVVLSAHPGRVKEIIAVEFPRPRHLALKRSADFQRYVEHIWNLLH
jgi:NitT/TauT family transport system ATP-binding protein